MVTQQDATPLHEDPVLLCYDIEEHAKHLDREVMYLLNKLRSHPPPRPKTKANATNTTTDTVSPLVYSHWCVSVYTAATILHQWLTYTLWLELSTCYIQLALSIL